MCVNCTDGEEWNGISCVRDIVPLATEDGMLTLSFLLVG